MKQFILILMSITLVFVGVGLLPSCGSNTQPATDHNNTTPTSHPKGQVSVEDDVSAKNILQGAIKSDAHSTPVTTIQVAKIEHILVNTGPLTVFAPTNQTFDALPDGTVESFLEC